MVEAGIAATALATLLINIPFGYWRAWTKKRSLEWFLAIHLPVPLLALLRTWMGVGLQWLPLMALSYATGQFVGSRLARRAANCGVANRCIFTSAAKCLRARQAQT